ncbi:MAG: hypothetical protein IKR85_06165 [Clostridia bacterium]|nr:hypothetical protein [Clostridia bacterium]
MKRLLCVLIALAFVCAVAADEGAYAEDDASGIEQTAYAAREMMTLLAMCPSITDFDGAPDAQIGREAVAAFRLLHPDSGKSSEQIYAGIFASGAYAAQGSGVYETYRAYITIDSVLTVGNGQIKASIRADVDYGDGYEFGFYADVYLQPDAQAPWGARVCRLFFPG